MKEKKANERWYEETKEEKKLDEEEKEEKKKEEFRAGQASAGPTNLPMCSLLSALHRALVLVWDELPVGKKVWISQGFTLGGTITIQPACWALF